MTDEMDKLRAQLHGSYPDILPRASRSLTDGSDPFLAAQAAFSQAIEYGAAFGDRTFVLEMFGTSRDLFQRSLDTQSRADREGDQVERDSRTSEKRFCLFVTENVLAHGDAPADFAHFDASVRHLVDALEPEAASLGGDRYGSAVIVEAVAMWALAATWRRPHDFSRVASQLKTVKVVAALRAVRDALVAFAEGGDGHLHAFDVAAQKILRPAKYDYGNVGPLGMRQAHMLSMLRNRGRLLHAVTGMFDRSASPTSATSVS